MLYYKTERQLKYGGDDRMRPIGKPRKPDSPDIDDLIFAVEHQEESEK